MDELKKLHASDNDMKHELKKLAQVSEETLEAVHGLAMHVDREIGKVRAVMVTKDYLDEKLANQYSDIIQHTRREIGKAIR